MRHNHNNSAGYAKNTHAVSQQNNGRVNRVRVNSPSGAVLLNRAFLGVIIKATAWILISSFLIIFVYMMNMEVDVVYLRASDALSTSSLRQMIQYTVDQKIAVDVATQELNEDILTGLTASTVTYPEVTRSTKRTISADLVDADFKEINEYLLDIADKYCTVSVNLNGKTIEFDGLAYLATANTESGSWTCDPKRTVSGAFPSAFVDINTIEGDAFYYENIVNSLNSLIVFTKCNARAGYGFVENTQPWMDDLGTQGALTQAYGKILPGFGASELSILQPAKEQLIKIYGSSYMDTVLTTCTGSKYNAGGYGIVADAGDRWSFIDSAIAYKDNMQTTMDSLSAVYPKEQTPNDYEAYILLRFAHWVPGLLTATLNDWNTIHGRARYTEYQAWVAYAHCLSQAPVIEIMREHAREDLKNYKTNSNAIMHSRAEIGKWVEKAVNDQKFQFKNGDVSYIFSTTTCLGARNTYLGEQALNYLPFWLYYYIYLEEIYATG